MAAGVAEHHVEGRQHELLAARGRGAAFARDDVVCADGGAGRAFGLRLNLLSEVLSKMKTFGWTIAEFWFASARRLFLDFLLHIVRARGLIVVRPLAMIREHFVGIEHLLEFARSLVVARVTVRVVAKYRLAIGALHLFGASAAFDSEERIIIGSGIQP